ncbi:3-carboxyethylcatechol 2,3-dioxygenase [Sphingomonas sp. AOB5]|uniref:3-carboxyethylcatechol 2,3-dioxygenase n=1 Tax=Sphingomonas sp. AOB5 TaxID=3034017 RepID=UPI0023FA346C|nr:3-carboxyethylcatechol 2,3-dioxygenase [Sphingomonas sp. AOB5]MDF7777155.1 3-carboxyethylcatechol 2,3-dioxygenase [Sphingomonas sp. AOB5]
MPLRLICASHTPLMDHVDADPAVDAEVRGHFAALGEAVCDYDPELVILFAPDHFKGFFYDMLPPFTVGVRATAIGDYDIGGGDFDVPEALALDCVRAIHGEGVDVAMSYRMQADHGFAQLLVLLGGAVNRWPVLPIHINCAGPPLPGFARVRALGEAVGRWAAGLEKRVLILGSGGLSHDPPIPSIATAPPPVAEMLIAGRNPPIEARRAREEANFAAARKLAQGEGHTLPLNPGWDQDFMEALGRGDLDWLDGLSESELTRTAGCGGHEVRNWVAAYAALGAAGPYSSRKIFYHDIAAWNAGMGIATAAPIRDEAPAMADATAGRTQEGNR